jgi:aminocarboxymuconate-semialdehyde decarboxylase
MIQLCTAERIALGSDYPFPLGEHHPGKLIESMDDLSMETKERLLSGTALEFLGITKEAFLQF